MNNLTNMKRFNKSIIVLSLGLALSACGGSDDKAVEIIEEIVNSAPTISSAAVTTVESGTAYSYSLVAADADGDTLTMTAANLPAWLTFDSATGTLSGTPSDADAGDTAVTLTVSDGTDEITQAFTITVTLPVAVNNAAVITSTGVTTATVGEAYSYTLMATDADSDTLTMSATIPAALSWLTFDATTGILSGTPASGDIAATEITLTVNDGTEDTMQMFTITVADAAVMMDIISFENAPETYTFSDFDGGAATVIANPDATGINTSVQVGQMTKSAGQTWGGSTMTLATPVAIPAGSMVTMKVWSSRAVPVLVKFDDMNAERTANHTGSGWEELTFDFTGDISTSESRLTLIFDNGVMGDAAGDAANWTFYFDDFTTPAAEEVVVVDPEGPAIVTDFEAAASTYVFSDFDGGAAVVLANPDATGINTSAQVGQMTKSAGQTWGGSTMTLAAPAVIPADSMVTMKVWSSRAVPVLVKFDDMNAERTANHTGSGWEELSFDFTGASSDGETRLTLIFDNGVMGDAAGDAANWTFYFDDFTTPAAEEVAEGNFVAVGTPYDFEPTGLGSDFTWAVFENDDNPALEFVANPGSSSVNDSATVAMFTARMTGQPWAGTETTAANTTAFTMDATNSIVKIMVYKSVVSDVAMKFSVGAGAQPELKVANTKVNEWEELTFDFSSYIGRPETIGIDSVIVFPDFNSDGRASDTVSYFDNITLGRIE